VSSVSATAGGSGRHARTKEPGELDRGDPDAGRGRVDENVLARLQLAEHDQRLVRCMYASDITSGREARPHAPVSQTSGMLAASTNERDVGFGMRCVAGDTMYSEYAPCGRTVCQQRREGMREGTHTVREPEDLVAFLPARARRAQNVRLRAIVALRRRRPDVLDGPRELDAEDLARALRHPRAVSASALPHPVRRARTRVHAIALHDVHPVPTERADLDEHPARARRGTRRVAEEERTGVALTVAYEHGAHRLGGGGHDNR
jgi:hypothetical protein